MTLLRRSRPPSHRGIRVPSSLWIDQPDAADRIESKRSAGLLSEEQAALASHFVEHGYAVTSLDLRSTSSTCIRMWRSFPRPRPDTSWRLGSLSKT
jgi:hypothetical protein